MKQVQLEPFQSAIEQTIPIIQQKPTDEKTRRQVMAIISLFRDAGDDVLVRELRFDLFKRTGGLLQIRILEPMFDELTKDTTITAWVAATDGTALAACAFLRNRKIDVPAQISVCGFDNRLEATTGRLTSYDFDTAGIFNQAISFAAGRSDVRSDHQTFVEWPGFLVVRHSTGKAKKV